METEDLEKDLHHPKIQEILDCGNLNPDKFDVTRTGRNLWKVERGLNEKIVEVRLFFFSLSFNIFLSFFFVQVCALRPKVYCLRWVSPTGEEGRLSKCKGVQRRTVERDLTMEMYKRALFEGVKIYSDFRVIRSVDFKATTLHVRKAALSITGIKR